MVFAIHWHESAMDVHVFPIPIPPSRLPPHPTLLGLPSAPAPSTCLMHPTWAGDLFLCYSKSSLVSISLKVKVKVLLMASQFLILSIRLSSILFIFYFSSLPTLWFCQTSCLLVPLEKKKWSTMWLVYFLFVLLGILFPHHEQVQVLLKMPFQEHFYQYFSCIIFLHNVYENPVCSAFYWFCVSVCFYLHYCIHLLG